MKSYLFQLVTPGLKEKPNVFYMCARIKFHTYDRRQMYIRNIVITKESIIVLYYMTDSLNLKRINKRLTQQWTSNSQAVDWETYAQNSSKSSGNSGQLSYSEQRLCKGEYSYGWYSTSGGKTIIHAKLKSRKS